MYASSPPHLFSCLSSKHRLGAFPWFSLPSLALKEKSGNTLQILPVRCLSCQSANDVKALNAIILHIQSNSSMHRYDCVVLCKDISLQRGRFCARSLASCIPRSSEDKSSCSFFIQIAHGRPGGCLRFSVGGSKMAWLLASTVYTEIK